MKNFKQYSKAKAEDFKELLEVFKDKAILGLSVVALLGEIAQTIIDSWDELARHQNKKRKTKEDTASRREAAASLISSSSQFEE